MTVFESLMLLALEEARISLREGNHGFGAVVAKSGELIAKARDAEKTAGDSTAHAEMNAIRSASARLGRDLTGCVLVSTHEPCPMCATAVIWSGISEIAYGYSIRDAIKQGRRRIDLSCKELFKKAGRKINVREALLKEKCSVLYNKTVNMLISYILPVEMYISEIPMQTLDEASCHVYSNEYDPLVYKVIYTEAYAKKDFKDNSINEVLGKTLSLKPLLEVWVDIKTKTIVKFTKLTFSHLKYENIPEPIF